jgi:hypothetical protein
MRSLAFLVILLAQTLHAAPTFTFYTDRPKTSVGSYSGVFMQNTSDEIAHDLVVTVELGAGLTFWDPLSGPVGWECTATERIGTCRLATLESRETSAVFFTVRATDSVGGHRSATVTLSARDAGTAGTVTFDVIAPRPVPVTTTADFGAGSLRAAIEEINEQAVCGTDVPCNIWFPGANPVEVPFVIKPSIPLPALRKCNVTIFGPDDPEFPRRVKTVVISGEHATYGNGLEIRAACPAGITGVNIQSIVVNSWPWNGIYFEAPAAHAGNNIGHLMNNLYVGTDETGLIARPNRSRGIVTDSPHEVVWVYSSIVSGNGRSGIALFQGKHGTVIGSKLGVDRNGDPMGNRGGAGFFSAGVPFHVVQNTIAYNGVGVAVAKGTPEAAIAGNNIHSNDGLPIDWGLDGRTPSDDGSDSVPNAPRVLSAFYDPSPNVTYVRGFVDLRAGAFGNRFTLEPSLASSARGDVIALFQQFSLAIFAKPEGGDVPFLIGIPGNHRGEFMAVQVHAVDGNNFPVLSSEISEGILVP